MHAGPAPQCYDTHCQKVAVKLAEAKLCAGLTLQDMERSRCMAVETWTSTYECLTCLSWSRTFDTHWSHLLVLHQDVQL